MIIVLLIVLVLEISLATFFVLEKLDEIKEEIDYFRKDNMGRL